MTTRPESVQTQDDATATEDLQPEVHGTESVPEDEDQPRLTVAAVARRLGVAPATLRTWDRRYGLGPGDHTIGQHRRYGADDLAKLEQMQRALLRGASPAEAARFAHVTTLPQHPSESIDQQAAPDDQVPEVGPVLLSGVLATEDGSIHSEGVAHPGGGGLRLAGAGPRARGLGRAVLALDSWSTQRLMIEAMEADGVVATWRDLVKPVLRATAERRQRSGTGIETLQLLTDSVSTALRAVIASAPAPVNPRPVVLASAPGEGQELELVALAAALAVNRVGPRMFAPVLPKEGLEAAVRRASPTAVVLWSEQSRYADPGLLAEIPNTRQRVRAFAAGAGWSILPPNVEFLDSLETAVSDLSSIALS